MNSSGPMRSEWAGGHGRDHGRDGGHHQHPRSHRALVIVEVLIVALIGCWLGLLAGGNLDAPVGPLRVHMSVVPSVEGGSVASIPPLGKLRLATHAGPWQLRAEVTRIDATGARRIFADPTAVTGLGDQVSRDLRSAARTVIIRAVLATLAGAVILGVLVFRRRWRRIVASGALSAALVLAGGGVAWATFDKNAVNQPEYDGLLASAPGVVGDARSIMANFGKYEDQLARLVTNVSRLYDVTSTLPAYEPNPSSVRVLFVSDLHLNPAAWDVIRSITKQFKVTMIVDAGDISDHGTAAENTYVEQIATLGVPYVWVRGNHDSAVTQAAVAAQPNAVALDLTTPVEVGGLRLIGLGDPRSPPTRTPAGLRRSRPWPRSDVRWQRPPGHSRSTSRSMSRSSTTGRPRSSSTGRCRWCCPGTITGASRRCCPAARCRSSRARPAHRGCAGWRGRVRRSPRPCVPRCCISTAPRGGSRPWDDITLGGLGLQSAKIERRLVAQQFAKLAPTPSPSPTESVSVPPRPSVAP